MYVPYGILIIFVVAAACVAVDYARKLQTKKTLDQEMDKAHQRYLNLITRFILVLSNSSQNTIFLVLECDDFKVVRARDVPMDPIMVPGELWSLFIGGFLGRLFELTPKESYEQAGVAERWLFSKESAHITQPTGDETRFGVNQTKDNEIFRGLLKAVNTRAQQTTMNRVLQIG